MQREYDLRQELAKDLANYKKAYRKNQLPKEAARFIAREIRALEHLLAER